MVAGYLVMKLMAAKRNTFEFLMAIQACILSLTTSIQTLVLLSDIFNGLRSGCIRWSGSAKAALLPLLVVAPLALQLLMTSKFFTPSEIYAIDTNPH
ncbi:hypothetical protein OH492_18375 [Vibrio chagasii]|nr:hypothetical protein [Vibrio chagasii]